MKRTAAPSLAQRAHDREEPLDLGPDSAAVGSSMIRTRASKLSALAISTICWSAIERPRTGRSGSSRTPRRSSSPWTWRVHRAAVDPPQRAERVVAHDDVLRDAEVGEERGLLVDRRRCRRRARRAGEWKSTGCAVDEHLAGVAPDHAAEDLDERGLARAVLAHQRAHLAGRAARGCRRAARGRRRRTSSRRAARRAASRSAQRAVSPAGGLWSIDMVSPPFRPKAIKTERIRVNVITDADRYDLRIMP